jgi:hypothetical protein
MRKSSKCTLWFCIRFICRTGKINEESSHEIRFRERERVVTRASYQRLLPLEIYRPEKRKITEAARAPKPLFLATVLVVKKF